MTQGFGNPDTVESLGGEVILHLFGIEFDVFDTTIPGADTGKAVVARILRWAAAGIFAGQTSCNLDLTTTDGDAGDGTAMVAGQVTSGASYATTDVENGGRRVEG